MPTEVLSPSGEQPNDDSDVVGCQGCAIFLAAIAPFLIPLAFAVWLYNRRSVSPQTRRTIGAEFLIGGILGCLIGAVVLFQAILVTKPAIPAGTLPQLISMKVLDDPASLASNGLVLYQKQAYASDVNFGEPDVVSNPPHELQNDLRDIRASLGHWYGQDATLSVDGQSRGKAVPTITEPDWNDTLTLKRSSNTTFTASAHLRFPISAGEIHKALRVSAEMTVTFPYGTEGGFREGRVKVKRSVTLFVVRPQEMQLARSLADWNGRTDRFKWAFAYLGVGVLSIGMGLIVRRSGREV